MKAILSETPGGPETLVLRDLDEPEPGAGEVRVSVSAIGVNFPDTLIIEDRYQFRPDRPFAPGAELAGRIEAVGPDVTGLAPGDRVMALPMWGAMAEKVCLPAAACHLLPESVDDATAAALQMTYGTALYALETRGELARGETVVVLGAAGGVGLAGVELAHALGARVVACASSEDKVRMAREHGAETGIVYPAGEMDRDAQKDFAGEIKAAVGEDGADIVLDAVGGGYTEPALRSIGWGGRFLVVGFPAGIARIPANLPLLKSCDIRGVFWGAAIKRDPDAHRTAMERLLALAAERRISPHIHARYPLAEAGAAIASLSNRGVRGKVLVLP